MFRCVCDALYKLVVKDIESVITVNVVSISYLELQESRCTRQKRGAEKFSTPLFCAGLESIVRAYCTITIAYDDDYWFMPSGVKLLYSSISFWVILGLRLLMAAATMALLTLTMA